MLILETAFKIFYFKLDDRRHSSGIFLIFANHKKTFVIFLDDVWIIFIRTKAGLKLSLEETYTE